MSENTDTRLKSIMDEQNQIRVVHEQRLTSMETRVTKLEITVPYMQDTISRLTSIADMQTRQGALTEAALVALKDGQELHSKNIEEINREQVSQGKVITAIQTSLKVLLSVIGTLGTALALAAGGYLFSLIQHPK